MPLPNELCWCGSGRDYSKCHQAIDSVPPEERLNVAHHLYARHWQNNSENYKNQNCYQWMSERLKPYNPSRILDIGCGTGTGLAALLRDFPGADILSIDENLECISAARANLQSTGIQCSVIDRTKVQVTSERSHRLSFAGPLAFGHGVTLIRTDLLLDEEFANFLTAVPKFDAITVWLIGSHLLRYHECENFNGGIDSPGNYRLNVQNVIYRLAEHVLRSGGVLQIVDRGELPSTEVLRLDTLNSHRDQATLANGTMTVQSPEYLEYSEEEVGNRIGMVVTPPTSGRTATGFKTAMVSVISVRK